MNNETFVTRVRRSALASTIAGTCLMPQSYVAEAEVPATMVGDEGAFNERAVFPAESSQSDSGDSMVVALALSPEEWTKAMEREFRRLVLAEAKGVLTATEAARLEQLNRWRDQLNHPRPTEEILAQLRRDRVLDRIAQSLKEYVEFREGPGKKRACAR